MSRKILLKPSDIFNDLTVIEEAERPENTKRKHNCLDNKIELIRMPYTYSFDQIKEMIMDII